MHDIYCDVCGKELYVDGESGSAYDFQREDGSRGYICRSCLDLADDEFGEDAE